MAKKSLGQHFLTDPGILGRIADALPAGPGDPVVEIGPGRGGLTRTLLERGFQVTAIERDRDLIPGLQRGFPSLRLVHGDALATDWVEAAGIRAGEPWWVIGNIPYNITSPLIDLALEAVPAPAAVVYLVQKEVALRLDASSGTEEYGALTVGTQAAARVERLFRVPAGAFRPPPRVDSAVIRLTPRPPGDRVGDPARFRRFVVGLFASRRKQLTRALRTAFGLDAAVAAEAVRRADLDPTQRPETLSVAEFRRLQGVLVDGGWADALAL